MEIDEAQRVMLVKFDSGNEGWSPYHWVHKLVVPTFAGLGWVDPNAKALPNQRNEGNAEETALADLEKILWIFNVSNYEELRKIEGC